MKKAAERKVDFHLPLDHVLASAARGRSADAGRWTISPSPRT